MTVGAAQGFAHTPATHACPVPQTLPHAPQLVMSVETFTHVPLQLTVEGGQLLPATHKPATHDCPVAHIFPHVPQLVMSVDTFTHVPLQLTPGGAQLLALQVFVEGSQLPLQHSLPALHLWPVCLQGTAP